VKFKALVFRPFRGEVLDGEVIEITDNGFMIESGPIKSFISTMVNFT
jgi:DNA-directed RNA polymerase II subunit RPB7